MARITTIPLFKSKALSAGDIGTAGPIDLRYIANNDKFSIFQSIAAGTSTTCGTTFFSYKGCAVVDGTYVDPASDGTFGTSGPAIASTFRSITPVLSPFVKIYATQSGAGTAGANSLVTAELIVQ